MKYYNQFGKRYMKTTNTGQWDTSKGQTHSYHLALCDKCNSMTNHYEDNSCAKCKNMNQSDKDMTPESKMYFKGFDDGKQYALDIITKGEGFEESYDHYAIKLGLPTKYQK